jgi:hypothetical protein
VKISKSLRVQVHENLWLESRVVGYLCVRNDGFRGIYGLNRGVEQFSSLVRRPEIF